GRTGSAALRSASATVAMAALSAHHPWSTSDKAITPPPQANLSSYRLPAGTSRSEARQGRVLRAADGRIRADRGALHQGMLGPVLAERPAAPAQVGHARLKAWILQMPAGVGAELCQHATAACLPVGITFRAIGLRKPIAYRDPTKRARMLAARGRETRRTPPRRPTATNP